MNRILGRAITYSNPRHLRFRKEMLKRGFESKFVAVMSTKIGMAKEPLQALQRKCWEENQEI